MRAEVFISYAQSIGNGVSDWSRTYVIPGLSQNRRPPPQTRRQDG